MLKKRFLVLVLSILGLCNVVAQTKYDIGLRLYYTGHDVLLRWYPKDLDIYQKCAEDGFIVERRQLGSVDGWIPIETVVKGSFDEISQLEKVDSKAGMLKLVLYKDRTIEEVTKNFPDSINIVKQSYKDMTSKQSGPYFYGMFLLSAEFSVSLSKYAALNFLDETTQTQQEYTYRVRPRNAKLKYTSQEVTISTSRKTELPEMTQVKIEKIHEKVRLSWYLSKELRKDYSGYNLERSEDGIHFKKVNERPIIHVSTSEMDRDTCSYRDLLPKCGKRYYYRITGVSAFGFTGKPSNVVSEMVKCDYYVKPVITRIEFNEKGEADVQWRIDNPENQTVRSLEVQRAERMHVGEPDTFIKISNTLTPKTTHFVDKKPLNSNFYRVVARGDEGQTGYSSVVYRFPYDTIPPDAPTDLKGVVDSTGLVTLTWKQNPDNKILGYRVFMANDSTDEFLCFSDTLVKQQVFQDRLSLNVLTKDVYYLVQAVGTNYGHSKYSKFVKVMRPDTIPPALIVVDSIMQNEDNSLVLTWYDSPSTDVEKVELYRNVLPDTAWVLAEAWQGNKTPQSFTDTLMFLGEKVGYRFKIYDDGGNVSVAECPHYHTKMVRPHCIKNLTVTKDYTIGGIAVAWQRCRCSIDFVRIYRREDGGTMKLLKTVKFNDTSYLDTKVYVGHEYEYIVHPITETMSEPEREKIKY
ncbi:MAG: fibronectin type III domain-containing protein [Paludibacteraceae bacterium]|nr:fibronectin type III domain-containing protein [Paludibacteraceae bacterium]